MSRYVVIGGSSGIGAAIVRALEEKSVEVINGDLVPPAVPSLYAPYYSLDVSSPESIKMALSHMPDSIDGYVHAAGIQIAVPIEQMTDDEITRQIAINLQGPALIAKYLSPRLVPGASVVLIASELAFVGTGQSPVYAATKGGVISLARSLAVAWRSRLIRVNALCPGATFTPLLERVWALSDDPVQAQADDAKGVLLGRLGTAEEIAKAALFLLSADSSFVDGHALVADGGTIVW